MISLFEMQEVVSSLLGSYPQFSPKVELSVMVASYHQALREFPAMAVRRAVPELCANSQYFPTARDLARAAQAQVKKLTYENHINLQFVSDEWMRSQDEVDGFAPALLTREPDMTGKKITGPCKYSAGEMREIARLLETASQHNQMVTRQAGEVELSESALDTERQRLEDAYYSLGFDRREWYALIRRFQDAGRPDGAAAIQRRLEQILAEVL